MNRTSLSLEEASIMLNKAHRTLSEDAILEIARRDTSTNNVVRRLHDECFGVWRYEDEFTPNYTLSYINGSSKLKGELLDLSLEDDRKFEVTLVFCKYLTQEYPHLDLITTFNTFSQQLRSYVEMHDYITVTSKDFAEFKDSNPTVVAKSPIIFIQFIDKLEWYREAFGNIFMNPRKDNENVIYLMLDLTTNHIKIGRSKNPIRREKTLQAEAPQIETIAFWEKPKETEKFLHEKFAEKRVRGEWFKLTFKDLSKIDQYMNSNTWTDD